MDWILIGQSSLGSWWLDPNNWLAMLKVAAGLGFVIFVHELGHFAVAKMCGVKCEKFYIGFDFFQLKIGKWTILPRALFKFKYGETEYGIGSFPLGGYVKMLGQDDNPRNMEQENERSRAGGESEGGKVKHDPRSYLAKSVPQRMAIISAGVVMNLIFAVIFATIAYMIGVPYMPCEIGDTIPGGAAWRAGVEPGSKVIQINGLGKPSENLRWDWDLRNATGIAGTKGEVELLMRSAAGTEETVRLQPRPVYFGSDQLPTLGVTGMPTTLLGKEPVSAHSPADKAMIPFLANDQIVEVRVPSQGKTFDVKSSADFERVLASHPSEAVSVTVERKEKGKDALPNPPQLVQIEMAPNRMRTLGLVMRRGSVTGIRPESPADKAGLKEGDIIRKFAGQEFGDPITFPDRLIPFHGQSISLEIDRPDEAGKLQAMSLTITPEAPRRIYQSYTEGADFSVESLGIVYPVFQIVQHVPPTGPAASAGIKPGDVITQFQIVPKPSQEKEERKQTLLAIDKPYKLNPAHPSWPFVDQVVQSILPESQIKLFYWRPDPSASAEDLKKKPDPSQVHEALLQPVESAYFNPERGLQFTLTKLPHKAGSIGEAVGLGLRQTYEDGTKIIIILQKVVTGKLSPTNFGGIGSITYVATAEASQGTPRLLLFLTFLSANLAVVNFLPIPVLDGGHMMFLAWEGIFRRPVPERWQFQLTLGGLAFVLCLFLFTNGLDVYRFVVAPLMRWLG